MRASQTFWGTREHGHLLQESKEYFWDLFKGATSRYFELFLPSTKLPLNSRKPENNTLQRYENTKEIIINHKGTRMVKDGED